MQSLTELCKRFFVDFASKKTDGTDMACFRRAVEQFCESGKKEDAFSVYFCYNEVFHLLGEGYENTKKLLELLADHEYHAGELLKKHRDHYSHSAYVFVLGLAIYAGDATYRRAFCRHYGFDEADKEEFLYLWGMTALFHDIGYPFQLAYEQVQSYTENVWGPKHPDSPYVTLGNLTAFWRIDPENAMYIRSALHTDAKFESINDLLAYGMDRKLGYSQELMRPLLEKRVKQQTEYMDHGYFSAVLLAKQMFEKSYRDFTKNILDVLTAILLHNSLNKYDLPKQQFPNAHPIDLEEHPLAHLLMLCDELQCWDREAFGMVSKRDLQPWKAAFEIKDNAIEARFWFERYKLDERDEADARSVTYIKDGKLAEDLASWLSRSPRIITDTAEQKKDKKVNSFASSDKFINLCDFAKAIHKSYTESCQQEKIQHLDEAFGELSLEMKISNIEQAKSYAQKLELINCFYSDKDLDYPIVYDFGENRDEETLKKRDDAGFLCREEHVRWVREKLAMGWRYGRSYITRNEDGTLFYDRKKRNELREHMDIVPYEQLSEEERLKDVAVVRHMVEVLREQGNIRIYRYRYGRKPNLEIAGVGHRNIHTDLERIKEQVKRILTEYQKNYRVIVRTCYAAGADQLIAECANELGITTKAVLPMEYEEYIEAVHKDAEKVGYRFDDKDELRMRHLLAQTAVCKTVEDARHTWMEAGKYVIGKCDKLIAIWDGLETKLYSSDGDPINRGGTYHCIHMARQRGLEDGKDIHIISCDR